MRPSADVACEARATPDKTAIGLALVAALVGTACSRQAPALLGPVAFAAIAQPAPELPVLADLEVFAGRLFVAASRNPVHEPGAAVLSSTNGTSFERVLDVPDSEGFIRVRTIGGRLLVPDLDPPGTAPGRVWISEAGDDFRPTRVLGAVHAYDVIEWGGDVLLSGALAGGRTAALFRYDGDVWRAVAQTPHIRAKLMVRFGSDILISKWRVGRPVDLLRVSDGVGSPRPVPGDVVPGEAITFRWFVSSRGLLLWSWHDGQSLRCSWSADGTSFTPVPGLDGEFVSDFAEIEGNLYALTGSGLFGSQDHRRFVKLADAPEGSPFDPVPAGESSNADATASLAVFRGALHAGASRNGTLYRIEARAR